MVWRYRQSGWRGLESKIRHPVTGIIILKAYSRTSSHCAKDFLAYLITQHPVKNIGFAMKPSGQWRLSPAFDIAYHYNPDGQWTSRHQMGINGKCDDFVRADLIALARYGGIKAARADAIIHQVDTVISNWQRYAKRAQVAPAHMEKIAGSLRLKAFR